MKNRLEKNCRIKKGNGYNLNIISNQNFQRVTTIETNYR